MDRFHCGAAAPGSQLRGQRKPKAVALPRWFARGMALRGEPERELDSATGAHVHTSSPTCGGQVKLLLVTDVGAANNSSGDWGDWADLQLTE